MTNSKLSKFLGRDSFSAEEMPFINEVFSSKISRLKLVIGKMLGGQSLRGYISAYRAAQYGDQYDACVADLAGI